MSFGFSVPLLTSSCFSFILVSLLLLILAVLSPLIFIQSLDCCIFRHGFLFCHYRLASFLFYFPPWLSLSSLPFNFITIYILSLQQYSVIVLIELLPQRNLSTIIIDLFYFYLKTAKPKRTTEFYLDKKIYSVVALNLMIFVIALPKIKSYHSRVTVLCSKILIFIPYLVPTFQFL